MTGRHLTDVALHEFGPTFRPPHPDWTLTRTGDTVTSRPLTDEQAQSVATILAGADNGCPTCAEELADDAARILGGPHDWPTLVARAGEWDDE